jgi:hypothetical protein
VPVTTTSLVSSVVQAPPIQINLNSEACTATFPTHTQYNLGYEINRKLSNDLNQLGGTRYNFIQMVTGPSTFRRLASSFVGDRTQSLYEPGEKFQLVMNEFPFAATLLKISTIWGGKALPRMMYARATFPRKRWNTRGEVEEVHLEAEMRFQVEETDAAIEYCVL